MALAKNVLLGAWLGWMAMSSVWAQSSRSGWGATRYADATGTGVTFRTWAPNATTVSVAGEFNGWSTGSLPLFSEGGGVWSRDVATALPGHHYKYVINGSLWRRDPYGRQMFPSGTRNSIVYNSQNFSWGTNQFVMPPMKDLVIYEMHIGTFFDPVPGDGQVGRFTNAMQKLDHLADLGINAIELMPISEFPTPTSWGYNLSYPFTIESSYGEPDDVKAFVKACHERGIAVLMDVVYNHWGTDNNDWSLWQYDGWTPAPASGGIFFYNEPNVCCTWWGPRPDFSRAEVREYILNNLRMWRQEYRISGFRWDAPKFILFTDDTLTIPVPDGSNLINYAIQSISNEFPETIHIAEDIKGVVGFNSHWDMAFQSTVQSVAAQSSDNARNMFTLSGAINGDMQRIIYSESHDTTGDLNNGRRLPAAIDGANAESYFARKRSALAAAIVMTSPGTPMLWQGQEMLATNLFSDVRPLDWSRTNSFSHIKQLYRDLIHLRLNRQGVSGGLSGEGRVFFLINNTDKVMGWRRYDTNQPGQDVVVIVNYHNTARENYAIPFPSAGTWYVHFNSDSTMYGPDYDGVGDDRIIATGASAMATVSIGRYSMLIASRIPVSGLVLEQVEINDVLGNENGIADPGETLLARVVVRNSGQFAVSNVTVEVTTSQSGVVMEQPFTWFSEIAASGMVTSETPVVVSLASNWICGAAALLNVNLVTEDSSTANPWSLPVGTPWSLGIVTTSYASTDVPMAILDHQTILSDVMVSAAPHEIVEGVVPWVRLNHTFDADLVIGLQHPDGTEVLLSSHRGGGGDNFGVGTCNDDVVFTRFDTNATMALNSSNAPFAGTFRPDGNPDVLRGKAAGGIWRLRISDLATLDEGALLCWGIDLAVASSGFQCETFTSISPDTDGDGMLDWWELVYFGGATNALADADDDGDGLTNREEFLAGTHPADSNSYPKIHSVVAMPEAQGEVVIRWSSVTNRSYRLMRATSLVDGIYLPVTDAIPATPQFNTYTDITAEAGAAIYRIEVK